MARQVVSALTDYAGRGFTTSPSAVLREVLAGTTNYYVATTGNDANPGTSVAPFATLQKAWDTVCALDLNGHQVNINVVAGTYTAGVLINSKTPIGGGNVYFVGDTATPANVVVNTTGSCNFDFEVPLGATVVHVLGFRHKSSGTNICAFLVNAPGCLVFWGYSDFNGNPTDLASFAPGSLLKCEGPYTISGSANAHIAFLGGGGINCRGQTVTLAGIPNWAVTYALGAANGLCYYDFNTFVGTGTGKRHDISSNATFITGGVTTPGDIAGTTTTDGTVG